MKLGQEPKGIFASGYVIQASFKDQHWDTEKAAAGETAMFIRVQLDTLLNPATSSILPRQLLNTEPFQPMHWDSQRSGIQIPVNVSEALETEWKNFSKSTLFLLPEEVLDNHAHYEGAVQQVTVNRYERNTEARKACIAHHGSFCSICKFDFSQRFGELGRGFIHVHHIHPLSKIRQDYQVDPINDLRPVCPNCHAMLHRRNPPLSIEELKQILSQNQDSLDNSK